MFVDKKTEAKKRLIEALRRLRFVAKEAASNGTAGFAITTTRADGSGQILASFAVDLFLADLALVVDAPPQTPEDDEIAAAEAFLDRLPKAPVGPSI